MLNRIAVAVCLLCAAVLAQEPVKMKWVGCGIAKKAFMQALANGYKEAKGVEITLEGGGATRGIRDVAAGTADLGGTCRHKLDVPEETDAVLNPVGWDAVVAIVNPENPVQDISFGDLKKVLTGEVKNWKELGGKDEPIAVFTRKGKISGVGLMARELIFWDAQVDFAGSTKEFDSTGPLEKELEKTPNAIGLTGVSSARKSKVKILSVNGKAASAENIMTGTYPIVRPLYLVCHKDASPAIRAFVEWTLADGQTLIEKEGTVTVAQGKKLWAKYDKLMKGIQLKAAARPAK